MGKTSGPGDRKVAPKLEDPLPSLGWVRKYAYFIYHYPWVIMLICIAFVAAMVGWIFGVYGLQIQAEFAYYRWSGTDVVKSYDAFVNAAENTYHNAFNKKELLEEVPVQSTQGEISAIVWEIEDGNVLELKHLKRIWELEDQLFAEDDVKDFCYKPNQNVIGNDEVFYANFYPDMDERGCYRMKSYCNTLKTIIINKNKALNKTLTYNDVTFDMLTEDIVLESVGAKEGLGDTASTIRSGFLGRDCTPEHPQTTILRTMITTGYPHKGYKNINDRFSEQLSQQTKWGVEWIKPIEKLREESPDGLKVYVFIPGTTEKQISDLIMHEVLWLIGSFGFVFVFAAIHLESIFVSFFGVIGIFFSIPSAIAIQFGVLTIHHFDALNVIGLFLICGIGSDSLFIIFDNVMQSEHFKSHPLVTQEIRLAYAVQQGAIALAGSIFTTAIAFLALCISKVRILMYFGIFCFLELIFSLIFALTWYIAVIAIHMKYFEGRKCCKKQVKHDLDEKSLNDIEEKYNEEEDENDKKTKKGNKQEDIDENANAMAPITLYPYREWYDCFRHKVVFNVNASGLFIEKYNAFERFFHNYWSPFVYFYRMPICVITLIVTVVMGYYTFQMIGDIQMQYLSNDHPLQHVYTVLNTLFQTPLDDFALIYTWGIAFDLKVSVSDPLKPDAFGKASFVKINISAPGAQNYLYEACQYMKNRTDIVNIVDLDADYMCPIEKIYDFYGLLTQGKKGPVPDSIIQTEQFWNTLKQYFFLSIGLGEPKTDAGASMKSLIGFDYYNDSLMYIGMRANMILPEAQTNDVLHAYYDKVLDFEQHIQQMQREMAPEFGDKGMQASYAWVTMETQDQLEKQALDGVLLAVAFSVVVIFFVTMSLIYTLMFLISVSATILLIAGILENIGWYIDFKVSVMIIICCGFCTDFIIQTMNNMAHEFKLSMFGKMQRAITIFSSPVFSALVTTLGAGCFLYGSIVLIFPPFATFLIMSGAFGIYFGFVALPAMSAWWGLPGGDNLINCCIRASKRRKERKERETSASASESTGDAEKKRTEEEREQDELDEEERRISDVRRAKREITNP
ncbi:hypothetical protein TRFO_18166 [Tritrichomonas foetus]|uniref:SSD domain-containing protein n=1 Tax=Tritrichomonas foetus TaxID=1144522 RepID=A0A1J4KML3_9EUKA|nr:hypothetical protein TRFO_18166 [Tritrichomonas foetus]|eukprot:OHT12168.1 hypothetical protein TRFO_18166 [Tritrichomonas foetus]